MIGSGGREHALCWKLAREPDVQLFAAPGNPGIAAHATTFAHTGYLAIAEKVRPDITLVGPEAPLVAGIVDEFRAAGFAAVGPTRAAAQIESSKAFAKAVMDQAGIPTAPYTTADNAEHAREALRDFGFPVVLKADGLAAGKGVVIAHDATEAENAIQSLFNLSRRIVIEEFLQGREVSFIVLTDGRHVIPLEPTRDHKTLLDGDQGPNTGGMGAFSDSAILSEEARGRILDTIIEPAIHRLATDGNPFTGFLYAGLILTDNGPRVLEFNARLGDPETQALMLRLDSPLVPALEAAAHGELNRVTLNWRPETSVSVVMAAHGYPGNVRTGDPITGIEQVDGALVFQAGTKRTDRGLETAGGRVLSVNATGPTLQEAVQNTYRQALKIHFEGKQYRNDIGRKG